MIEGRLADCQQLIDRIVEAHLGVEDQTMICTVQALRSEAYLEQGRLEESEVWARSARQASEGARLKFVLGTVLRLEARIRMARGRWGEAAAALDTADGLDFQPVFRRIEAGWYRGIISRRSGRTTEAWRHLEEAVDGARRIEVPFLESAALVEMAGLAREADEPDRAGALLVQAQPLLPSVGRFHAIRYHCEAGLSDVAGGRGDPAASLARARELAAPLELQPAADLALRIRELAGALDPSAT